MNPLKIKNSDYLIALSGYFLVAFFILGGILLSPATVGFFHDWFIGPYPEMNKNWATNGLYKWDTQAGNKNYDTDWIFRLILLSSPVLAGEVLTKGLLIISITLSGFGAYYLARTLRLDIYVSFIAGMIYIFSPIIFTRIVAGHAYYLIAYFLPPLIVASFIKGKEHNKRYFVIGGLLLSFAIIQIQFLVMISIILVILSLTDIKRVKKSVVGL